MAEPVVASGFVEAGADDAASGLEIAFYEQPHRDRSGVPSARGEAAKDGGGRSSFVEMKRLWIEFGGKALDAVDIDADALGSKGLSRLKVFKVRSIESVMALS